MPKWPPKIAAPTLMLWVFAAAVGIASGMGADGTGMPKRAELVSSVAWPFLAASWVMADARRLRRQLCYDYDSFLYFAWPILVPVYLFQTRGVRALLTLLCFAAIWLIAAIASGAVFLARGFFR